ncbi:MAG: hypothetical protein AAGA33_05335 [Pseudomonadota bacterium]
MRTVFWYPVASTFAQRVNHNAAAVGETASTVEFETLGVLEVPDISVQLLIRG